MPVQQIRSLHAPCAGSSLSFLLVDQLQAGDEAGAQKYVNGYLHALKKDLRYGYSPGCYYLGNSWPESGYEVRRVWVAGRYLSVLLSTRNPEETFAVDDDTVSRMERNR